MKTIFRQHAVERMFEREISIENVIDILANGRVIKEYADDKPFPSKIVLGFIKNRPLHIVAAENKKNNEHIVITVYEPTIEKWNKDYDRRLDK